MEVAIPVKVDLAIIAGAVKREGTGLIEAHPFALTT